MANILALIECVSDEDGIESYLENISINAKLSDALKWSSLYGGSLIVMLINDGGLLEEPLNENSIKDIEELRVYDRWSVSRQEKYNDPADKRFGKTKTYMISPVSGAPYTVHESRCIVVDGIGVPDRVREQNDGWGASKIQQCYDQLVRLGMSHVWGNALLERAQQAVHGIEGLTNILRSPGGENLIRQRIDLVDMARSINNTVVIDGTESYDIKSTSFAGVTDIMDRISGALCAVTGMPETLLFGKQQKGLNNSGQGDLENWYANIKQQQETVLLKVIDRIVTIALKANNQYTEDYLIEFCPLWMPSEKENAEVGKLKAESAKIYVELGALDPSELRKSIESEYEIDDVELMPELPDDADGLGGEIQQESNEPDAREAAEIDLIRAQAESLRRKVEAPKTDSALHPFIIQPTIEIKPHNIDVRVDMPEIKIPEPVTNIHVDAPSINVTHPDIVVNVPKNDTPVTVYNNVKPADVKLEIPLKKTVTTVTRDENGEMTGSISIEENK